MRLIRRIPKRGFKSLTPKSYVPVCVADLSGFADGTTVDAVMLTAAGLAKSIEAGVKILGGGELSRKLTVKVQAFSASAKAKIEAKGGTCEVVSRKPAPAAKA